jgi:hypothetical protein
MSLQDPEDEPARKDRDDDEEDDEFGDGLTGDDSEEPIHGIRVPRKATPARSTAAEDRATCITWYVTFLIVIDPTALLMRYGVRWSKQQ